MMLGATTNSPPPPQPPPLPALGHLAASAAVKDCSANPCRSTPWGSFFPQGAGRQVSSLSSRKPEMDGLPLRLIPADSGTLVLTLTDWLLRPC